MGILIASKTVHVNYRICFGKFPRLPTVPARRTRSRCCIESAPTAGPGFSVRLGIFYVILSRVCPCFVCRCFFLFLTRFRATVRV